jgi:hypothetical protein
VDLPPDLIESDVNYVIVDEGPGLSGSSFGSVADRLQDRGVPLDRIAFLPSHPGDLGGRASDAHRERWRRAQRIAAQFNPEFLVDAFGPLEEFSTGGPFERRKFLATHAGERVLLKFAGLGRIGARKLEIARRLFAENLVPEPLDLVHGFIVERWCDDASSVPPSDIPLPKIATYIAARTRLPRAAPDSGASIEELLRMARRNVSLEFGDRAARSLGCWESRVADLQRRVMRILTDNKLDRIEWLRTRDGAVIKTDALDHHCGHDLIGCQDFAWDVAGAIAEFDLDHVSADALIAAVEQFANRRVDRELVDFCLVAYLAFRLGQARLGGQSAVAVRYSDSLHEVLQYTSAAKRLESLVD